MKRITRRQVFVGLGATGAVGAAAFGGLLWKFRPSRLQFGSPAPNPSAAANAIVRDYRVPDSDPAALQLAIARDPDPAAATEKAIAAMGSLARFVAKGDVVAIKPNIGWVRTPIQAGNTNPAVVATLVRLARAAGAKRVIVIDGSCDDATRSYEKSGIASAASDAGAEVLLPKPELYRDTPMRSSLIDSWPMLEPILSANKIINVPIAKHHSGAGFTGALKNWFGLVGGERGRLHWNLQLTIAELAHFVRPTLNVIDASRVLLRNGPKGGNLDDVEERNTVLASIDPVAADAYACTLLGKRAGDFEAIRMAASLGVGTADWASLRHRVL
ncbi:MAG TPA: DUF362 domain-containing protein [Polyangiaceae bacterium]|nr:DUF362 domain-containing protein [Polyangiaceae bacterium]